MVAAASERRALALHPAWVLGLLAMGCAQAAGDTLRGQVMLGPVCAGPLREGQSCEIGYADVEVQLIDSHGAVVGRVRTDAQGAFVLKVPQPRLTLHVVSPKVVRCPDQVLHAPLQAASTLVLACDSGRR
jgi:hypothetical protein